jgi:hypothetical protein
MADEQLLLSIEQHAESVRTSMTWEDCQEALEPLTSIIEKESNQEAINEGRLHELMGHILRSLVPAFVMTDADFKVPGSLNQPTKHMIAVKDACTDWLKKIACDFPFLLAPKPVGLVQYRRRMRMSTIDVENDDVEDETAGSAESSSEWSSDDENTPPSELNARKGEKNVNAKNKSKGPPPGSTSGTNSGATITLDPIVGLFERFTVRCPDKTEWRRAICDSLVAVAIGGVEIQNSLIRYIHQFLVPVMTCSDKAAWRVFALEAVAVLVSSMGSKISTDDLSSIFSSCLKRTNDSVAGVRSVAMKSVVGIGTVIIARSVVGPFEDEILQMLKTRSCDDKPMVRRSAISIFDQLVVILGHSKVPLDVIERLSQDESLMVRKSSISSIVALVEARPPSSADIHVISNLFCRTILPMITDVESSVVEKVIEAFESIIVSAIGSVSPILLESIGNSKDTIEYAKRTIRLVCRKNDSRGNKSLVVGLEK